MVYVWNRKMRVVSNGFWYVQNVSISCLQWHEFRIGEQAAPVNGSVCVYLLLFFSGWLRGVEEGVGVGMLSLFCS